MGKTYSKTKLELMILIDGLMKRFGNQFTMKLLKINQQNEFSMYSGKLSVDASYAMIRRIPRDYDNPEGIQRALIEAKVNNIIKMSRDDPRRYSSPNAVVLALNTDTSYVTIEQNPTDEELAYYKVDLKGLHKEINAAEVDEDGYLIDESKLFVGMMIDGHHRTAGLFEAGKLLFECPVTVYIGLPKEEIANVFKNINKYQDKPSAVHTLAMEAMSGTLSGSEETAHAITALLTTEEWSVLYERIKTIDGRRPSHLPKTYVTISTFEKLIVQQILNFLPSEYNTLRKARLLNDYFSAWSEVFDDAWGDTKNHVLVKSMGFQIMMRLFNVIYQKVSLSGAPTKDDFKKFIQEILKDSKAFNVDKMTLKMDWNSADFGSFSSGKGINAITSELTKHITNEYYKRMKKTN